MPDVSTGTYFYSTSRYVRRKTTEFLQYIFHECELCSDFRFESGSDTGIYISSEYPDISIKHPQIIVSTGGFTHEPTGFGEFRSLRHSGSEVQEWGGRFNFDAVNIEVRTYSQDETEEIIGLCMFCFATKNLRDAFVSKTGITPNITRTSVNEITRRLIPGTDKYEWIGGLRFPASIFWFSELDENLIETIAKEYILNSSSA